MKNLKEKGFGIIEVLLVSAIMATVFLGIMSYLNSYSKLTAINKMETEALYHARSSLEQARAVRDENSGTDYIYGWNILDGLDFAPTSHYNFQLSGSSWIPVVGDKIIDRYTIWITLDPVYRDVNDDIDLVGGVLDNNSMKVISHVSFFSRGETKEIILFEYLTNFK